MSNPLTEVLPAQVRKLLYAVYGMASLLLTCVSAYYANTEAPVPTWLKGLMGAAVVAGSGLGLTAASNVTVPSGPDGTVNEVEDGLEDVEQPVQTDNSPRPEDPLDQPPQDPGYIPPSDDVDEEEMA